MGSSCSQNQSLNNEKCLICWEEIEGQRESYVECFRCNIQLHENCERQFRSNKQYCKCIHCQSVGTQFITKTV